MSETTTESNENVETVETNTSTVTPSTESTDYKTLYEKAKTERDSFFTELKGFKSKATQAEKEKVKASTDVEQVRSWADEEIRGWEEKYNGVIGNLVTKNIQAEVATALAEAKGSAKLLTPHLMAKVKGEYQEDGSIKVTILGDDGNELFVRGKSATIKDLVAKMRESDDFAAAFQGSGATGGGATNVVNTQMTPSISTNNPWITGHRGEQMALESKDPTLAAKLKAAAKKK